MINHWATSDWHFQHKKMLTVWNDRPRDYQTRIIDNFCETVGDQDIVWMLGDMLFSPEKTRKWFSHILRDMPGKKFLVRGNHDCKKRTPNEYWIGECGIVAVFPYFVVRDKILFSHFPMRLPSARKDIRYFYESMLLHDEFVSQNLDYNLHGHTHRYHADHSKCVNVCVDVHNFKPMNINHLMR